MKNSLNKRIKPSLWQDSYIHLKFLSRFFKRLAENLNSVDKILDFGCGDKPYQLFFKSKYNEYIGIDIYPSEKVDYIISQSEPTLPFNDNTFDLIICTQVLEHLPNPFTVVKEFHRVCKISGKVIVSVPFCWEFHPTPNDYWRFSEQALLYIFKDFSKVEIVPDSTSLQTIIQFVNFIIRDIFHWKFLKPIRWILITLNNILGILTEKIKLLNNKKITSNFIVIAQK